MGVNKGWRRPAPLAGTLAVALAGLLWLAGALAWPEWISLDMRYRVRGTQDPGNGIVIVAISHRMFDLGIYRWPLSREYYTHALANLRGAGVRAVGLDVLLESVAPGDAALAAELGRWHGRAVLAYRAAAGLGESARGRTTIDARAAKVADARAYLSLPGGGVLAPNWPRGLGYVEVVQEADGVVHRFTPRTTLAGASLDSFPLALLRAVDPAAAGRYDRSGSLVIDYAGPAGTFPAPGSLDLDQVATGLFDPRLVVGKTVLIGATDPSLKDLFSGPFDGGAARTSGTELNATMLWTLQRGLAIQPVPEPLNGVALLALGAMALGAGLRLRPLQATLATLLLGAGFAALCQALFDHQVWLDLAGPLLAGGLAYVAVQAARAAESLRELRRVEGIFGRYVSPAVVRQLLGRPEALQLGGRRREISVLFSDIRGFTTLSERLRPEEVGAMLNEYFSAVVDVVFAHGGTVDKFVGDAIVALFNAPLDQPDHAQRAVSTARAMQEVAATLASRWAAQGKPALRIGIGVHTGPAVVGSFGSERRSDYTAIGDTMNVASRLEGLSKDLGCSIVISEVTAGALSTLAPFEPLGRVAIRGREESMALYGVRRGET